MIGGHRKMIRCWSYFIKHWGLTKPHVDTIDTQLDCIHSFANHPIDGGRYDMMTVYNSRKSRFTRAFVWPEYLYTFLFFNRCLYICTYVFSGHRRGVDTLGRQTDVKHQDHPGEQNDRLRLGRSRVRPVRERMGEGRRPAVVGVGRW